MNIVETELRQDYTGMFERVFEAAAYEDNMNIKSMIRNAIKGKGVDAFIEKNNALIARKVGQYLKIEWENWPYGTCAQSTANRKRVKEEIVKLWEDGI